MIVFCPCNVNGIHRIFAIKKRTGFLHEKKSGTCLRYKRYLIFIVMVLDVALYLEVAAALILIFTVPFLRNVIFPLEDAWAIFLLLET